MVSRSVLLTTLKLRLQWNFSAVSLQFYYVYFLFYSILFNLIIIIIIVVMIIIFILFYS